MKKISIIGAGGMAGHILSIYLSKNGKYKIQNLSRNVKLDDSWVMVELEHLNEVERNLREFRPDIVVNCSGMLVKNSDDNPGMAAFINGYFPHFLEKIGPDIGFKLIHLSTDCVFFGGNAPYAEMAQRDGKGFYAQSKAMGEVINKKDLTVRTSIIGPELKENATGLFHWLMMSKGTVKGYSKVFWNGVTTLELAKAIEKLFGENVSGLIHLTSPEVVTKYELLVLMRDVFEKKDIQILNDEQVAVDKTLKSTRADILLPTPGHKQQLVELREWMLSRRDLYRQYFSS